MVNVVVGSGELRGRDAASGSGVFESGVCLGFTETAKLIGRCSDGMRDQCAEEALWGQ
jgi:hypothetical protein